MDEKTERNKEIVKRVLSGNTMSSVGKEFGITKQRVKEIFDRDVPPDKIANLMPLSEYLKVTHKNKKAVIKSIKEKLIKGTKIGNKYYIEFKT